MIDYVLREEFCSVGTRRAVAQPLQVQRLKCCRLKIIQIRGHEAGI